MEFKRQEFWPSNRSGTIHQWSELSSCICRFIVHFFQTLDIGQTGAACPQRMQPEMDPPII